MDNFYAYIPLILKYIVILHYFLKDSKQVLTRAATYNWIKQFSNSGSFKTKDNRSFEENELIKLRKELKQLRMENDILKQAALIIGRK
ncbi:hypothetical protein [Spiroplasma endosymbiont of Dasysyrphus albostriatus]|uniref:hypothetical protein n=1 Tax=Spiroplasma endosymbiont of Dasysyrphus albostriatus TaxID=3066299 RepID=UPI0030CD9C9B